jgi:hypothetical protein
MAAVPLRIQKQHTVADALANQESITNIQGGLSLIEHFQLWAAMQDTALSEEDCHMWRFDKSGEFTSKSSYCAPFNGAITFEPWRQLKTRTLVKCKVLLWLDIRNKCWTADRLA